MCDTIHQTNSVEVFIHDTLTFSEYVYSCLFKSPLEVFHSLLQLYNYAMQAHYAIALKFKGVFFSHLITKRKENGWHPVTPPPPPPPPEHPGWIHFSHHSQPNQLNHLAPRNPVLTWELTGNTSIELNTQLAAVRCFMVSFLLGLIPRLYTHNCIMMMISVRQVNIHSLHSFFVHLLL